MSHVYAVILAGGSGTRLWPYSRQLFPKQFLRLEGEKSLLQQTAERLAPLVMQKDIWVMTGADLAAGAGYQELQAYRCITEPCARNTAPAIGVMAAMLETIDPEATVVVLPADHAITDVPAFQRALALAIEKAQTGPIITFGITPTRAETGYGYIQACQEAEGPVYPVTQFVEKPEKAVAETMLAAGHFYWNSGMFVAKATTLLSELATHAPPLAKGIQHMQAAWATGEPFQEAVTRLFATMPAESFDYAVMEKSANVRVLPCQIGWSDVGSWAAVYDILPKNGHQSVVRAKAIEVESSGNILMGEGRIIATVGVSDMCIIDTPDALLVAARAQAQDVKKVVDVLKAGTGNEHVLHRTVQRPWGSASVLEKAEGYKIKMVEVKPGGRLSLQSHAQRSEHWVVVAGVATVTHGTETLTLPIGQSTFIPANTSHCLENRGEKILRVVEVQVGDYLEEDDIIRYEREKSL